MLHQTLPLFFHFNPSTSSSTLLSQGTTNTTTTTTTTRVEPEMECVAAKAFKTKFWPETTTTALKPNQPLVFEDFWAGSTGGGVSVDEFFADEFLDFSKEDNSQELENHEEEEEDRDCVSVSSQEQNSNSTDDISLKEDLGTEFSVPTDDMADLEWLSHFVDDSFSEFALPYSPVDSPQLPGSNRSEPEPEPEKPVPFPATQVPARPRTKRSRTGGRVWSSFAESSTTTTATATSTTSTATTTTATTSSSASSSPSCLIFATTPPPSLEFLDHLGLPAAKKQKKNPATEKSNSPMGAVSQRRCSHCGVQKTPQWRAGPLGAKTLCNACGVRFKSGRLLPEYRPACSPTFSSEVHSNSHRKVLEMRRKKEAAWPESEVVQSF